jgi:hypothetical protein
MAKSGKSDRRLQYQTARNTPIAEVRKMAGCLMQERGQIGRQEEGLSRTSLLPGHIDGMLATVILGLRRCPGEAPVRESRPARPFLYAPEIDPHKIQLNWLRNRWECSLAAILPHSRNCVAQAKMTRRKTLRKWQKVMNSGRACSEETKRAEIGKKGGSARKKWSKWTLGETILLWAIGN